MLWEIACHLKVFVGVAHKNVENPQRMQQIHASITGADRVAPDP